MMRSHSIVLVTVALLAACTTTKNVIIDERGVDMSSYREDLAECQVYAEQVRKGEKTARGAASGAAVGGAIGAILDGSRDGAARGAGVGAVSGGVRGAAAGEREEAAVVKRCLRGRGYKVLN